MKFIRKNGKVIPIKEKGDSNGKRKDGGQDLRKKKYDKKNDYKAVSKVFKEHSRDRTIGERFKMGSAMGTMGAVIGTSMGFVAGEILTKKSGGKVAMAGGLLAGGLLASIGSAQAKVMSKRKFNKEYGKELAKMGKKKK